MFFLGHHRVFPDSAQQFPKWSSWVCFHSSPLTHWTEEIKYFYNINEITQLNCFKTFSGLLYHREEKKSSLSTRACILWYVVACEPFFSHAHRPVRLPHFISFSSWQRSTFSCHCSWQENAPSLLSTWPATWLPLGLYWNVSFPELLCQRYLE